MSGESPQSRAAGDQALWQSQLSQKLSGIALPELSKLTSQLSGILGTQGMNGQLAPDAAIKQSATNQLNTGYDQAIRGSGENIAYQGLRSGGARMNPGAYGSATMSAATSLDRDRSSALRNLEFMSAQSSMQDYNQVLQLLGQGTQTALGMSQGFSGAAGSAIGGMSNQTMAGGIIGGASAGAGIGGVAGPYGALFGSIIGGVAGGLSSP